MELTYFKQFGLTDDENEALAESWELSQASYPADGLYFVQEDYLKDAAALASLRAEALPAWYASGAAIRSSEALSRLAWHCHWMLHIMPVNPERKPTPWTVSPCGCTFFAGIVAMANLPYIKAYYQERNIPENILRDGALALDIWAENYHDKHGVWGCEQTWVNLFTIHNIFRLHRLEFQFGTYESPVRAYRSRTTGKVVILMPAQLGILENGYCCQADETPVFTTTFQESETSVTAYPATENGRVAKAPVTLDLTEWELLFKKGDPMINIHIPACAPLSHDECLAGIQQAREFFPTYFPDFKFKGFQTGSWLLDTALQELLPPTANIVRFQSLFHLYPKVDGGSDWQIKQRVFGDPDLPMDQVPLKSSLQKIVHEKICAGYRFRSGNMLLER